VIECHPPVEFMIRTTTMAAKNKDKKDGKKKGKVKTKLTTKELTEGELDKVQGGVWRPIIR
jgi:hypothetical protein